jgi:hypothetical protein
MNFFSRNRQKFVYSCVFASLFVGMLFSATQCFAANPPLKTVSMAVVPVGNLRQLNFSINDPVLGVVPGNSGPIDLASWDAINGVVYWIYWVRNPDLSLSKMVGFSVYDPKTGVWNNRTTVGIDTDVVSSVACGGGVVSWKGFSGAVRFAIYDSELNSWVIGSSTSITSGIGAIDATGMVAWYNGNAIGAALYDPSAKVFRIGFTAPLPIPSSFTFNSGTVVYTANGVPGKLGYSWPTNGWGNFFTVPKAYFIPSKTSGPVPLRVFFWDMSLGANSWNWSFNDGTGATSTVASPFYTFNSAFAAPFNVELIAGGPAGGNALGRAITPTTPHSISGTAANASGFKIAGASVTLSGTHSKTVTTDASGNYSFGNLTGNGNYTVTITKPRTTFTPPSRSYTNLTGAQTGNFTGKLNDKPADFDGDGKTDPSIFRSGTNEWWVLNSSTNSSAAVTFGLPTDKLVPRDYDGDGRTDFAVWRPSEGNWYILQSSTGTTSIRSFGTAGDIPVANDYDGDDKADIAVFRPSDANWYVTKSSNSVVFQLPFGAATDKVVPGDYDGDEKGDFAVFRPSEATWYVLRSSDFGVTIQPFGNTTDKPVQGDYDGDGKTDFATFTPLTAPASSLWNIKRSSDGVVPPAQPWGFGDDYLAPGDYDGDGKIDVGVFRPSDNTWYAIRSSDQVWFAPTFGAAGDYPVPNAYIPQ